MPAQTLKNATFHIPGALRVEQHRQREGIPVIYSVWQPGSAWFEADTKQLIKRIKWPIKTPTGDALRAWIKEVSAPKAAAPELDMKRVAEEGFGPEAHLDESDPNHQTKMVV